jgi:hypothetical protein
MGNLSLKSIKFQIFKEEPKFFIHIDVNTNEVLNDIDNIKQKLYNLQINNINKNITEIIQVINKCAKEEPQEIIEQIDYYLFYNYNYQLPMLEIQNIQAKNNQEKYNTKNDNKYYCKVYSL